MKAKFSVEADRSRGLIRIALAGFFTTDDIRGFLKARNDAQEALGCGPNKHLTLCDTRELTMQSLTIVDAFEEILAAPERRARRLAFVVGPALAGSRILRALISCNAKCFTDPIFAEAWLFAADTDETSVHRSAG
jgi:hypothetical protein